MSCPDLEQLERFAAGEDIEADGGRDFIAAHLEQCAPCRVEFESVTTNVRTVSTLRSLHRSESLPPSVTGGTPERIGAYRILEEVGRGGMGVVYRAMQGRPHREVALKVVHPGFASERSLRRFELEVEVLGRLEHPGIAHIFEAGTADVWGERRPFFAMEYVRGQRLHEYCAQEGLGVDAKLALFERVCEGVHHAHLRGVIHRDLKPGNILVGEDGEPKVIDFGLARVSDPDQRGISSHTEVGNILGTLPFMAPEQLGSDPDSLDVRADVYGLGAVLFHLLCDRPPLVLDGLSLPNAALRIANELPPAPSSVHPLVPREIDWICAHALEKEPDRRYSSVSQLADDLRRFRLRQPLHAGPPSKAYRMRLFVRRHSVGVTVSVFTVLALLFGLINAMRAADVAQSSAVQEREGRLRVESLLGVLLESIEGLNPAEAGDADPSLKVRVEHSRAQLEEIAARVDSESEGVPLIAARLRTMLARTFQEFGDLQRAEELLLWAVATRLELLGPRHPETAESKHFLASLYIRSDRRAEAEPLLLEALEVSVEALGEDDPAVQRTRNSLGTLYFMAGRLDEAEEMWTKAFPLVERELGPEHKETLMLLGNIGSLRSAQGRYAEAEEVLLDVLERRERALGVDHPHTVKGRSALARIYQIMDRPTEALALQEQAVASIVKRYGERHPESLNSRYGLALLYAYFDRRNEAVDILEDVLQQRRTLLGPDHRETLAALGALGVLLRRCGRYDEALPILREAHDRSSSLQGQEAFETLTSKAGLGTLLLELGRLEEAEPYLVAALEGRRELLPEGHRDVFLSIDILSRLYRSMGRFEEAERLSWTGIEVAERLYGAAHSSTLGARVGLAVLRRFEGRLEEAREILVDVLRLAEEQDEPDGAALRRYRQALAHVDLDAGRAEEALAAATEIRDFRCGQRQGADYPDTLSTELLLYQCVAALGRSDEAGVGFVELLKRSEELVGPEHPTTLRTLTALAELRMQEGRWSEARAYASRACQVTSERNREYEPRLELLADIERRMGR